MKKKYIVITVLIFVITSVLLIGLFQLYNPLNSKKIEDLIINDIVFLDSDKTDPMILKPQVNKNKRYEIVKLKNNWKRPMNPVFTVVSDEFEFLDNSKTPGLRLTVYELRRDSFFKSTYSLPKLPKYNVIANISFSDAVTIVSNYDITGEFPGKDNYGITNYAAVSQEQIDINATKLSEKEKFDEQQLQDEEQYKNGTTQEKLSVIKKRIAGWQYLLDIYGDAMPAESKATLDKNIAEYTVQEQQLESQNQTTNN